MVIFLAEIEPNWVMLKPGVPVRMHFIDHVAVPREITDPYFGVPRTVQSLVFRVDRQDGVEVERAFSILSDKLKNDLSGYLVDKRYRGYEFIIVKPGPGTVAPRIVEVRPL